MFDFDEKKRKEKKSKLVVLPRFHYSFIYFCFELLED